MTYPSARLGQVSTGFIPAECLVLVPNVGFQWLCGEPVHPDVIPLLATSRVSDPVVSTVTPSQDVVAPDGTVLQEGTGDLFDRVAEGVGPREAGFGILGLLASLLAAAAISTALGSR